MALRVVARLKAGAVWPHPAQTGLIPLHAGQMQSIIVTSSRIPRFCGRRGRNVAQSRKALEATGPREVVAPLAVLEGYDEQRTGNTWQLGPPVVGCECY
jgi:hypothetical protein